MRLFRFTLLAAICAAGPLAACESAKTSVAEIYPTGTALPENLLRFYIYFSRPMGQGDILPHIALLDDSGAALPGVFLSNRYDLWSADRTRLTLLFDPGRVKTGLVANTAMGRALVAGEAYRLEISQTARDAQGCPLRADHSFAFTAVPADISTPSPEDWTLTPPNVGTSTPLNVILDGPVDHLSLAYRLRIMGPDGAILPGRIGLAGAETRWTFTPTQPWQDGPHSLVVDPKLEDLAGNRMDAVFDLDLQQDAPRATEAQKHTIPFKPKS